MKGKIVIASLAALVLVGLMIYTRPRPPVPAPPPQRTDSPAVERTSGPRLPAPRLPDDTFQVQAPADDMKSTNWITRLLKGEESPRLTLEQAESFVQQNHRSAESLLVARDASGERAFLREAMEKYPNDPRVAFRAAFLSGSYASEEEGLKAQRQWLDTLKQSAPDNALGDYLSAANHFKSGQGDLAVQELLAAGSKPLQDYSLDFIQSSEEAYRSAGYSDAEAKAVASSSLLLPQMSQFKQVGLSLAELAKTYRQSGDEASAQAALQMASNLGQRLDGGGSLTLIQSLVGIAVQRIALNAMDPNAPYGDSGQTVQNQIDALKQHRTDLGAIVKQAEALLPTMSEQDLSNYFDRRKVFGEDATARWAVSKFGQQ
jgi:hypothetical protein